MGRMPDYYPLFIAADRCHCSPWELLTQATYWRDKALIVNTAENQAQEFWSKRRK